MSQVCRGHSERVTRSGIPTRARVDSAARLDRSTNHSGLQIDSGTVEIALRISRELIPLQIRLTAKICAYSSIQQH